jgi:hypothetical protein
VATDAVVAPHGAAQQHNATNTAQACSDSRSERAGKLRGLGEPRAGGGAFHRLALTSRMPSSSAKRARATSAMPQSSAGGAPRSAAPRERATQMRPHAQAVKGRNTAPSPRSRLLAAAQCGKDAHDREDAAAVRAQARRHWPRGRRHRARMSYSSLRAGAQVRSCASHGLRSASRRRRRAYGARRLCSDAKKAAHRSRTSSSSSTRTCALVQHVTMSMSCARGLEVGVSRGCT